MSLEDSKFSNKDVYALILDFTSLFNTTDHDSMLRIIYDLGLPTDAIDTVKNLYEDATTQIKLPSGDSTKQIPAEVPSRVTLSLLFSSFSTWSRS